MDLVADGWAYLADTGAFVAENWRLLLPIGLVGLVSWSVWAVRKVLSLRYRPTVNEFRTTTSVVVPSYHEDPDVLEACLDTWLAENPDQVVIVLDVADAEAQHRLIARHDPRLDVIMFAHQGKRSALGVGIRAATAEVVVLTDSDTRWVPGLLAAVQMPFVDPMVGAVGTRQNVFEPNTSVWRRVADWITTTATWTTCRPPAAPGRWSASPAAPPPTAAYRRSVVLKVLPHLEHEFFLGRRCIAGDDGRLTWLVLASGFRAVHQSTARALWRCRSRPTRCDHEQAGLADPAGRPHRRRRQNAASLTRSHALSGTAAKA